MNPRFCVHCGEALATKEVEGRSREVCTGCGKIHYQNPLPVASALVLNEKREVLLVKRQRDPARGMWCLPIGFAELNETIAEAALRELFEESGIQGRTVHLLDVGSYPSDFYGDLLIVTFEAEKIGGEERPGDDAADVGWFPLDGLPPLAFHSNEKAIAACREVHSEEWAIRDSFDKMQAGHLEEMLSDQLVHLIQEHAREIAFRWLVDVMSNPTTPSYRNLNSEELLDKVTDALMLFGGWLTGKETGEDVRAFYSAVGVERRAEGLEAQEVLSALTILRKHVWGFVREQDLLRRPIDVYRVMELNRRLMLFFDKAMYHSIKRFTENVR